jgi:8-oxo-dGTP diphosphatase
VAAVPAIEPVIEVVSIAFVRDGSVLTVRKRGTSRFMLVGGKPEPGETAEQAARREVREEVGLEVGELTPIGEYVGAAANEPGHRIRSTTFQALVPPDTEPEAQAEIEELRWHLLAEPATDDLAPVLTEFVLPLLRRTGALED